MNIFHSKAVLSTHLICVIVVCCMSTVNSIAQSKLNCDLGTVCCYPPKDCILYPTTTLERPVKINKGFDMAASFTDFIQHTCKSDYYRMERREDK